ncbi:uncharacterized protein LOC105163121 isoform X3 [Sesamum indicum]|uniref:Uncharacterized protein LOC105163121 isoform X3 n=1 Tax=Sesamum indicum TaxID=4182 RepID=A0A8M8V160_SESIN|nr:uncharacterized protein LOC105163121 isoform X3 [Sesamum indicum]
MEEDFSVSTPCSSIAVDSVLRMSSVYLAVPVHRTLPRQLASAAFHVEYLLQYFLLLTVECKGIGGRKTGLVNTLAAGVLAGAAFGAGTRNWKQVAGITGLFCTLFQFAQDSKSV